MEKNFTKRLIICLLSIFIAYGGTYLYINEYKSIIRTEAYYYGSTEDIIYKVQDKLKRWGYYNGEIDGVYGYQTYKAVKSFQVKNGLNSDGVIGNRTLSALGLSSKSQSTSSNYTTNNGDVDLLSKLINGEARGEPYEGQVAVGAVVLNRVRDSKFPSTVAGVIYQPGAFTAIVDGQINVKIEETSKRAARDALNGWDPSGGAIYYFNPAKATNKWIWSRPLIKIIGKHRFCK